MLFTYIISIWQLCFYTLIIHVHISIWNLYVQKDNYKK